MFDIRDHGGVFGGGKYRRGSEVSVSETKEKVPITTLQKVYLQTTVLRDPIGEDDNYYYHENRDNNGYLRIYAINKNTGIGSVIPSNSTLQGNSSLYEFYSNNSGYIFALTTNTLNKIDVSNKVIIWSTSTPIQISSKKSVSIFIDNVYIYVMTAAVGGSTYLLKFTLEGSLISSTQVGASLTSRNFLLKGNILYSQNSNTFYKHDIKNGAEISSETVSIFNDIDVDYINRLYYTYENPNIVAKRFNGTPLWSFNISSVQPTTMIAMKDGVYIDDYFGRDVKLGLDGSVRYTNYQPYPVGLTQLYHEYGKSYLLGNTYGHNGVTSYHTPTKMSEIFTLGG